MDDNTRDNELLWPVFLMEEVKYVPITQVESHREKQIDFSCFLGLASAFLSAFLSCVVAYFAGNAPSPPLLATMGLLLLVTVIFTLLTIHRWVRASRQWENAIGKGKFLRLDELLKAYGAPHGQDSTAPIGPRTTKATTD